MPWPARRLSRYVRRSGALIWTPKGAGSSLAELEQVHRHKTGALIECAVTSAPCTKADVDPATLTALQTYAAAIGLPSRCRTTSSTSRAILPPWASRKARIWRWKEYLSGPARTRQCRELARELHDKALTALQSLPYNADILEAFADYIIERTHQTLDNGNNMSVDSDFPQPGPRGHTGRFAILPFRRLPVVCNELREYLLRSVSRSAWPLRHSALAPSS